MIRDEVARRIGMLGRGGLILSPAYGADTPEIDGPNLVEFLRAAGELG